MYRAREIELGMGLLRRGCRGVKSDHLRAIDLATSGKRAWWFSGEVRFLIFASRVVDLV